MAEHNESEKMADVLSNVLGGDNTKGKHKLKTSRIIGWTAGILIIVVLIAGLTLVVTRKNSSLPEKTLKSATFPVYYPKSLPTGYSLEENSQIYNKEEGFLSYTISTPSGSSLFITQQPKPRFIEETTHTEDIDSKYGNAFIANLEGRYAGFLYGEKTLVIITTGNTSNPDSQLQLSKEIKQILTNLEIN